MSRSILSKYQAFVQLLFVLFVLFVLIILYSLYLEYDSVRLWVTS